MKTEKRAYLKVAPEYLAEALQLPPGTVLINVKALFEGESTAQATMFEFYIAHPDLPDELCSVQAEYYSGYRFIKV